jgi:hypothetical protein|nr:MAG TPA: minor capsid protein [Caudoviricetes sp.]
MQVSKDRISQYRKELDSAANDAAEFMSDYYDALRTANPNASVADLRNMAIKSIKQALNAFSPQAGELAGELFDEIVKAEGVKARFRYHQTIEQGLVDKKVHYLAKDLVDGNNQKFIDACATLTRFYVHREANTNVYRNVARSNIRWARVPSGTETCGWCFMLSTRGFDYTSELKAGGLGHKFHLHCDCIIVPGTEDTTIDGYKPEEMYARWVECANTLGLEPTWENRFAIIAECETRDFKWLYNGTPPEVTYATPEIERSVTIKNPWEDRTAHRLAAVGIEPHFQIDYYWVITDGIKHKVGLPDFENGVEIKTPQDSENAFGAVKNYVLKTNKRKKGVIRMVIDNSESKFSDADLIKAIQDVTNEFGANYTIACFTKTGELVNVHK